MFIELRGYFRRLVYVCAGLLVGAFSLCGAVAAQGPPAVTTGSIVTIPSDPTFSQIYKMAFFKGNVVALDGGSNSLYQLAPGATQWTYLVSTRSATGVLGASGGFDCIGMAMDAQGTLYLGLREQLSATPSARFFRVPYDPVHNTWSVTTGTEWGDSINDGNGSTIQSLGVDDVEFQNSPQMDGSGTLYFTDENGTKGDLLSIPVDNQGNPGNGGVATYLIQGMKNDASTFKVDAWGNVFLIQRHDVAANQEVVGLFFISAASLASGVVGTGTGNAEAQFTQIDTGNSVKYAGVTLDAFGNLYMTSENNSQYNETQAGIWEIPNSCSQTTKITDSNVLSCYKFTNLSYVAPVAGNQPLSVDSRGYLWIPTYQDPGLNGGASYPNMYAIAVWAPGSLNVGAVPAGLAGGPLNQILCTDGSTPSSNLCANGQPPYGTSGIVYVNFNTPETLGAINFSLPDFSATQTDPLVPTSGTPPVPCTLTTTQYTTLSTCQVWVAMKASAPGSVSAQLTLLDSNNNPIAGGTTFLGGTGVGPAASLLANPMATTISSSLVTPAQVASDAAGDTYVADPGAHKVVFFKAGSSSGTSVGRGLTSPTGVAVDASGNVFIADSGTVYEVSAAGQTTLASGLGATGLNLALDTVGNVYVTDPANARVVKIVNPAAASLVTNPTTAQPWPSSLSTTVTVGSGFTAPSAIAVDSSSENAVCNAAPPSGANNCAPIQVPSATGNVFVADGSSLYEITPWNVQTVLTNTLSAPVTGLAVDPSGSVIVAQNGGIVRIPSIGGTLSVNSAGPLEASVAVPGFIQPGNTVETISVGAPQGVAMDQAGNLYITDTTNGSGNLYQFAVNGFVNFGVGLDPGTVAEEDVPVVNTGNAPLNLANLTGTSSPVGFSGPDAAEFSLLATPSTGTACDITGATSVATGGSCNLGLGFTPPIPPPPVPGQTPVPTDFTGDSVSIGTTAINISGGALTAGMQASALAGLEDTQTAVSLNPAGSTYPGSTVATVTITPEPGGGISYPTNVPSGTVTLTLAPSAVGSTQPPIVQTAQATGDNTGTTATFTLTGIPGGTYNVTASYGGNITQLFKSSNNNSAPVPFTVAPANPTVTLAEPQGILPDSVNGLYYVGATSTTVIIATVTSALGAPTGSVTFMNGTNVVGTETLDANGNATLSVGTAPIGAYNLTAVYNGDQNFSSGTSASVAFQVINPSVLITANPTSVTTKAGTPVAATLSLHSLVGFSAPNTVNISCDTSTMPHDAECTFSVPQPVICSDDQANKNCTPTLTTSVAISTNIPVNVGSLDKGKSSTSPFVLAGLFGLGLLGLGLRRRRIFNRYLVGTACLVLFLAGTVLGLTSCTNSSYTKPIQVQQYNTKPGSYNVNIVITDPGSGQVESLPFTLGVTIQ